MLGTAKSASSMPSNRWNGGRYRIRTCDFHRVNVAGTNTFNNLTGLLGLPKYLQVHGSRNDSGCGNGCCCFHCGGGSMSGTRRGHHNVPSVLRVFGARLASKDKLDPTFLKKLPLRSLL
jgi:hypothetical protein